MKKNYIKRTLLSIVFTLITSVIFSQLNTSSINNNCYIPNYPLKNIGNKTFGDCGNPSLEHYLKRPPIITSFIITEDRNEKVELVLKDSYSFSQIEMEFKEITKYGFIDSIKNYIMYDDGSHGDEIANDKIYTNNEIYLKYISTNSYLYKPVFATIIYKNNEQEVHTEKFYLNYISLNTDFIDEIEMPNVYAFDNPDYLFTDNFIYYNKYNNWRELECNQFGGGFPYEYINSKSLLYNFWGENVINNQNDKNLYMQVDFSSPYGQFLWGQDIFLGLSSLNGVQIHEILHLWVPEINSYLGYEYSDSHNGHHANIFKSTSGFLYSAWSHSNGIFCEKSLNDFNEDSEGKYLFLDFTTSYENCNNELELGEKSYFNDFELYIMNVISIDEVNLPIKSLKNIYKTEEIIDSNSGYSVGRKLYYESIIEIDKDKLVAAKEEMLSDLSYPPYLDASNPNNFILTFSGNKPNLTENEIKMLWVLSKNLTTKNETSRENFRNTPTFYEATGKKAEITSNIPLPKQYTGDFYTTEYISINYGENYNGWTENGEYKRTLNSIQYKDSIVTTHLKVLLLDDDNDGVMNNLDLCPDTPSGETVDVNGCSSSQIDSDGDGVSDDIDTCPDTPTGETVDANGCIVLASNNFTIETISETCPNKNNGRIIISAQLSYNYIATINGADYDFTSSKTLNDLAPGSYDMCIVVKDVTAPYCYNLEIKEGTTVSGKSSVTSGKASVEIEAGTAPYTIYVNGEELFKTNSPVFNIDVKHGDKVEVKTKVACEGVYSKTIDLFKVITVYPNPTSGIFEIALPMSLKEVKIALFTINNQLISSKMYVVVNGKVQLNIENMPAAMYFAKVYLESPVSVKILKQ